jgi:hypothetical protein
MTISKLTNNVKPLDEVDKINEIIDELDNANVAIDNSTITKNGSDQLQTVAVIDNRSGSAIKTWTGTKAQYEAIVTKDSNTLYNITDDTDATIPLLEILYPVGSLYIATGNVSVCPLAVLGVGTWQQKANSTLVTDVNSTAPVIGNGNSLGLTDGSTTFGSYWDSNVGFNGGTNNVGIAVGTANAGGSITSVNGKVVGVSTDGTKSGIEANITSTTLSVTIWERIS